MNRYQKFFAELQEKFTKMLYEEYDLEANKLHELQNANKDILLQKIANIMLNYNISNEFMNLDNKDRLNLRDELFEMISNSFIDEIKSEKENTSNILNNCAKDKFYNNCYLYEFGVINYNLKKVSNKVLKDIINVKIEGKNYSDRIWSNKNDLSKKIKVEVNDFLNGKTSVNEINTRISKRYNQNWDNTNRLVTNEISRVQEGANEVWRDNHNIKKVLYSATLDKHTCSDCGEYDGKVYDVDKTPVDLPKHVRCRCTYISLVSKNWRPKLRMDNETKERINWQSYTEWKENKK
ncbi:minor capsid protein [Clostridium sp.]|uniref:minor capsid protein n=1 Tax=Clostridium sp. TaxID=1506 RepID=UPI0029015769|nr:minor capsid protein [Clostridium sp.]MDU7260730.1 minor capsid protein [Clostridium butyricum]MDU1068182.1 minor capsid protein [Clostridium sp.]MDU2679756.1 minor capsid protein [Clostridium sp.]MDU4211937.1 minor capsid protein [Clostridium sp.]MDU5175096.1 minor capsid protein [Clostridium sp.]